MDVLMALLIFMGFSLGSTLVLGCTCLLKPTAATEE